MVKNLLAMQETWVWSLGQEDPLEEGMATHSIILAWRIPWREEPGGLQSMRLQRVGHDWAIEHPHVQVKVRLWGGGHDGIGAPITWRRDAGAHSPCPQEEVATCKPGSWSSPGTKPAGTLVLDFPVSKSVRSKCLLFRPAPLVFCMEDGLTRHRGALSRMERNGWIGDSGEVEWRGFTYS